MLLTARELAALALVEEGAAEPVAELDGFDVEFDDELPLPLGILLMLFPVLNCAVTEAFLHDVEEALPEEVNLTAAHCIVR